MEHLPVEVIGNILSQLKAARDVVIASTTCKKWLEAWRHHVHTLSFNSNDWSVYHDLTAVKLEILITRTIFQTTGLECLSIFMDDVVEFSAAPVTAWLMYTRDTLRRLHYNVGGLGDVITSLSRAVQDLNHNVDVILPKYDYLNLNHVELAYPAVHPSIHVYLHLRLVVHFCAWLNMLFSDIPAYDPIVLFCWTFILCAEAELVFGLPLLFVDALIYWSVLLCSGHFDKLYFISQIFLKQHLVSVVLDSNFADDAQANAVEAPRENETPSEDEMEILPVKRKKVFNKERGSNSHL